ncbi:MULTISPECIES: preprotein translocase subunit YajC [Echinicola]|uniref:Sec translocon accessory complex subunit YajC n=2 Tax=Echinicola TaxID=390846 RepID=L0FZJ3_ECHVK|nr:MULTISPECIES: preprotein translocase subunit YajC [Echinicola]AGA78025.1 preprotein translocase, YajC subunit [Echinicola vietnamensis DSM 17526]QDH79082.1 preprotein translocase subunit YajC [Echinicola soli]
MTNTILLQAQGAGGSGIMGQVFLFGGIILIMYFFMIRPQQKKQKDAKNFIESIKKGDQVVTIGGIHGKVYAIEGETVLIELDKGLKIKVEKSAVSAEFSKKSSGTK